MTTIHLPDPDRDDPCPWDAGLASDAFKQWEQQHPWRAAMARLRAHRNRTKGIEPETPAVLELTSRDRRQAQQAWLRWMQHLARSRASRQDDEL